MMYKLICLFVFIFILTSCDDPVEKISAGKLGGACLENKICDEAYQCNEKNLCEDIIIEIKDPQLEYCIFLDTNIEQGIDPLTLRYALKRVGLMCNFLGIKTLEGIEHFKNLEYLEIAANNLTDLNAIKDLIKLEKLAIGRNKIVDISMLKNLTQLTEFTADDNQISDISVIANFLKLIKLRLKGNHISDISPLANLYNLQEIMLHANCFETENCQIFDHLFENSFELDCGGQFISDFCCAPENIGHTCLIEE